MTTKEMIAVMQAYEEGKQIQILTVGGWQDFSGCGEPFWNWEDCDYRIKPEEEKPKRMTNRQLSEWIARGFGERSKNCRCFVYVDFLYGKGEENGFIDEDVLIRPWGSDDWVKPTVDIYERDCKGE